MNKPRDPLDGARSLEQVECTRGEMADNMAAVMDALISIDAPFVSKTVFIERMRGATYAELASELGVTPERVRQRYFKTMRRIMVRLYSWGLREKENHYW